MTAPDLGPVLHSGVNLLRELSRRRTAVAESRRAAAAWAASHPELAAQLVTNPRPGSPIVDYDLLIDDPAGGTIMLGVQPDDGASWLVDHSTHWAAGNLLTVDGMQVSTPEAMLMLRSLTRPGLSPQEELVRFCVLRNAAAKEDVGLDDVQAAADGFRRRHGLTSGEAMRRWLERMGMSAEAFHDHMTTGAKDERFRTRMRAELAAGYLARHRERFARVWAVWAISADEPVGVDELHGPLDGRWDVRLTRAQVWAGELPEPLREASAVGPVPFEGGFLTGVVLKREEAVADAATLAAAGADAFEEWLADAAEQARVTWHWL
ncbi:TIGR04500 family putative peptide maturation system protein [Nonomuraea sp. PA05]|uniref:TIGR04500 family putative peptide maturation system protein n=1 Tax=Nonomuraea sp. PA05 TaxID=2604466 RepID=UPI0011D36217|nr:TIGR04500 family putative peptide maturation system protein [Nonomuraea sp. PA05]TYB62812.1 TIGR04500 family putative peptide maturation system protein [Nonomuraea sp. PA05]